jgi:hypothetical protein
MCTWQAWMLIFASIFGAWLVARAVVNYQRSLQRISIRDGSSAEHIPVRIR